MNVKGELRLAVASNQKVAVRLHNGEIITGVAEELTTSNRLKIRTEAGTIWIPIVDVEHVSRVISMLR
ncbi:hypothetical protein [Paenibacillus antarcticus]|uniref:Uncharacterized protein n=1 Tax=Paenibacillus antarcticus TaxID=253703 RepID=A0A168P9C4_9BACL|nr:hypothetical protein [Paenibacillus antarcticus]OAB46527.1 hypothetical protein PBAT_10940 [Paenibacillus antarcticus]